MVRGNPQARMSPQLRAQRSQHASMGSAARSVRRRNRRAHHALSRSLRIRTHFGRLEDAPTGTMRWRHPARPQRNTKMLYLIRTEPTPACSAPIQTRESTCADSSPKESETRGASGRNVLTRRWTIGKTSGDDSIMTCCWEETAPSE
jgi:hypothetical protein